jgi:hypothetical protein
MWWQLKLVRTWGIRTLVASAALSSALGIAMYWAMTA